MSDDEWATPKIRKIFRAPEKSQNPSHVLFRYHSIPHNPNPDPHKTSETLRLQILGNEKKANLLKKHHFSGYYHPDN